MDPQYDIAKHVINTTYQDLPLKAIEVAKMEILDSIGTALAGSKRPVIQMMLDMFKEFGGKEQSTVIARGIKLPPMDAAAVNSVMMAALDYDAVVDFAPLHPSVILLPVCFAMSGYQGKVSGKELIAAVAIGVDLLIRLPFAAIFKDEVERTLAGGGGVSAYMITAAIAGKMLGFNEDEMVNAIGLAYRQSVNIPPSGSMFGGNLKGSTFEVRGGLLAALMVKHGIRVGDKDCIEGPQGFYHHFYHGRYDREVLLGDLGKNYYGARVTIKPYPSCRMTHSFITAALALANEHDIRPDQVVEIEVIANDAGYSLCTPIEEKRSPKTPVVSQFSPPWCVAAALVRKKATIGEFSEEAIKDPVILGVANKIKVKNDPNLTGTLGATVTVKTKGGTYTKHIESPPGGPDNQLSFDDCVNKFNDCASYSFKPLTKGTISRIIKSIENLEEIDDIAEIMKEIS
jgi:2-methylcitrate dehydratase PrpD